MAIVILLVLFVICLFALTYAYQLFEEVERLQIENNNLRVKLGKLPIPIYKVKFEDKFKMFMQKSVIIVSTNLIMYLKETKKHYERLLARI